VSPRVSLFFSPFKDPLGAAPATTLVGAPLQSTDKISALIGRNTIFLTDVLFPPPPRKGFRLDGWVFFLGGVASFVVVAGCWVGGGAPFFFGCCGCVSFSFFFGGVVEGFCLFFGVSFSLSWGVFFVCVVWGFFFFALLVLVGGGGVVGFVWGWFWCCVVWCFDLFWGCVWWVWVFFFLGGCWWFVVFVLGFFFFFLGLFFGGFFLFFWGGGGGGGSDFGGVGGFFLGGDFFLNSFESLHSYELTVLPRPPLATFL